MSNTEHLVGPKRETRRQSEVVAGTGRRRIWTTEQKARIVAESYASSASVIALARRHGLTPQQLYRWRSHDRHQVDGARGKDAAFAPVMLGPAREEQSRRNGKNAASRSLTHCAYGSRPSSLRSRASRRLPRRSAMRSHAGKVSRAFSTTGALRSTPTSSSARSDP